MSTLAGHSALQALHEMQRSITSFISGPVSASVGSCPESTMRSAFARPRVESFSSPVTMKLGHIVPASSLRQTALPLHCSTAAANPPGPKSRSVRSGIVS
jgi:hypothetical protein